LKLNVKGVPDITCQPISMKLERNKPTLCVKNRLIPNYSLICIIAKVWLKMMLTCFQ